jgi:hypothetical protein
MPRLDLIVTDASPLITLASADALECLTMPDVSVIIPDMVYFEVTQDLAKIGAQTIIDWVRKYHKKVEIAPTSVFAEFQALRAINPQTRSKGRGELSAMEILNVAIMQDRTLEAILIYEDSDIKKQRFIRGLPENVTALSTGDLLYELEAAGKIQSSDYILDLARNKQCNVDLLRQPQGDETARMVLREHLKKNSE